MNQPRGRLATLISAGLACLLSLPAAAQSYHADNGRHGRGAPLVHRRGPGLLPRHQRLPYAGRTVGHLLEHHPVRRLRPADQPAAVPWQGQRGPESLLRREAARQHQLRLRARPRLGNRGQPVRLSRRRHAAAPRLPVAERRRADAVPQPGARRNGSTRGRAGAERRCSRSKARCAIRASTIPTRPMPRGSRPAIPAAWRSTTAAAGRCASASAAATTAPRRRRRASIRSCRNSCRTPRPGAMSTSSPTTTSPARSRPTCASATPTRRTRWSRLPTSRGGPGAWRRAGRRPESSSSAPTPRATRASTPPSAA